MGKPMWIFERLQKGRRPHDIVARYFQAKRRLVDPKKMTEYTADDSVAVLSVAAATSSLGSVRSGSSIGPLADEDPGALSASRTRATASSIPLGLTSHSQNTSTR